MDFTLAVIQTHCAARTEETAPGATEGPIGLSGTRCWWNKVGCDMEVEVTPTLEQPPRESMDPDDVVSAGKVLAAGERIVRRR